MTESTQATCPRCGTAATGKFCAECGTPLAATACATCGTTLSPGAQFCHRCGAPVHGALAGAPRAATAPHPLGGGPVISRADRTPWAIALVLCVASVSAVVYSANKNNSAQQATSMSNAGNSGSNAQPGLTPPLGAGGVPVGRAPDISNMSPKERFVRLEGRITQALQAGDSNTVVSFTPMALQAYAQLPDSNRDVDAQYHAAMLEAQVGMFAEAVALSDTILKRAPDNLFGYYIRATVGEFAGDSTAARKARASFRAHYDAEMKKNRPEYSEHRPFLEQYRKGDGAN